jgi:negative regulator of flagellin synthesis FlgM
MSGKITGFGDRPVQVGGKGTVERPGSRTAATTPASVAGSSEVNITDTAVQLAALEKALAQVPDVDMKRVEALRRDIESGNYKVDPKRIADKLLELERNLASAEKEPQD